MLKACIGGALVAMAVWMSPPGKEASQVVDGGKPDCTGVAVTGWCFARRGGASGKVFVEYGGVKEGDYANAVAGQSKNLCLGWQNAPYWGTEANGNCNVLNPGARKP
jgi:hypothetical protein